MNWYHQYTPGDMWDYDAAGTHILIDGQVAGQPRKLVTHSGRNGFLYAFERANGQTVLAKPYVETVTWTKGIDQKTGLPVDYDPTQGHPGLFGRAGHDARRTAPRSCARPWRAATITGRHPTARKTRLLYIPSASSCNEVTLDPNHLQKATGIDSGRRVRYIERNESDIVVVDPFTGEVKKQHARRLSEQQRGAHDRRRPPLHRLHRRNVRRL